MNLTPLTGVYMSDARIITVNEYPDGILAIDTGFVRDRMACCYLLEAKTGVVVIETGTNATVERILKVLQRRGWRAADVRCVIVTHVHLDHAGGAGLLMQALPEAEFLVHPRGAPHMIDPSRLETSARSVYGDQAFDRIYGRLVPVDAGRLRVMGDGERVALDSRELRFMDTPGHARHHFCVHDSASNGWFSGDTFGLSYRELDTENGPFIFPTTTPIEFDPEALRESIRRLAATRPDWMYLTHYGRVGGIPQLAGSLLQGVDTLAAIARQHHGSRHRTRDIARDMQAWLVAAAREHGVQLPEAALLGLLEPDIKLNTQGLEVWLDRIARTESE